MAGLQALDKWEITLPNVQEHHLVKYLIFPSAAKHFSHFSQLTFYGLTALLIDLDIPSLFIHYYQTSRRGLQARRRVRAETDGPRQRLHPPHGRRRRLRPVRGRQAGRQFNRGATSLRREFYHKVTW